MNIVVMKEKRGVITNAFLKTGSVMGLLTVRMVQMKNLVVRYDLYKFYSIMNIDIIIIIKDRSKQVFNPDLN